MQTYGAYFDTGIIKLFRPPSLLLSRVAIYKYQRRREKDKGDSVLDDVERERSDKNVRNCSILINRQSNKSVATIAG